MDSITHITLGACTAELFLSKRLGKRALFWGVIAQSLPDIDVVAALFVSPEKAILFHRGITHSIFFALLAGLALALLAKRLHRKMPVPLTSLVAFFFFELVLHDLIDTCNSYGTGLLEPFFHERFSINLLYVADPLFTTALLIAFLYLVFKKSNSQNRRKWALSALVISCCYLCFAGISKIYVDKQISKTRGSAGVRSFSTPAPFNCMLWYMVTATDSTFYTGYYSIWDKKPMVFEAHPQNRGLLKKAGNQHIVNDIIKFADYYYTVTEKGDAVYINILRFEQIQGWARAGAPFALSYPISAIGNQELLLQKGRLAGWNKKSTQVYIKRIFGDY